MGRINLKQVGGAGASAGQVPTWTGSAWVPATSSGSARPALCYSKNYDPSLTVYTGATTVVLVQYSLASGYQSLTPSWWQLPASVTGTGGQVNAGLRLYWSDSSSTDLFNTATTGALMGYRWQTRFNKDGLRITQIAFLAANTSSQSISANLGQFLLEGEQT